MYARSEQTSESGLASHSSLTRLKPPKRSNALMTPIKAPERPRWGGPRGPQRPDGLFNLHGIGFMKAGMSLKAPQVPQVTIMADGQKLVIPTTPIRFTNLNGYTDQTRYQVYGKLGEGSRLTATSNNPEVKFEISPIVEGRATVKCVYQGKEKIYLIN